MVPMDVAVSQWGLLVNSECPVLADMVHPGASTSGLMRPSQVGPREENEATVVPASSKSISLNWPATPEH